MAEEGFRITYATMTADNEDLHKGYDEGTRSPGPGWASSIRCTSTARRARSGTRPRIRRSTAP
jgi:hypothetical protein